MSTRYVVEFEDANHTKYFFDSSKEAHDWANLMAHEWKIGAQVYPEEPETFLPTGEQEQRTQYYGICECCLVNRAEKDEFLCEECIARMLSDMESEETDKY